MNNLTVKIKHALKISKNYTFESFGLFALLADSEGWTDGIIVNLKPVDVDIMKSKAKAYSEKLMNNSFRYTIDPGQTPKIQPILSMVDNNQYEPVTDIEWDLLTNSIVLISENNRELVNPMYVKYFATTYKMAPDLYICKNIKKSPIEVRINGDRVGLIMPIY